MKEDDEDFDAQSEGDLDKEGPASRDFEGLEESLTSESENRQPRRVEEKEVEVVGVYEHQEQGSPAGYSAPAFVLLRDKDARQVLIWVGRFEAYAISVAMEGVALDRPMTHDLLRSVVDRLGGKVEHILIDDLWQDTYYAKITVATNGDSIEVDSRPSDAIALALRTKSPIYMAESVLEQASVREDG